MKAPATAHHHVPDTVGICRSSFHTVCAPYCTLLQFKYRRGRRKWSKRAKTSGKCQVARLAPNHRPLNHYCLRKSLVSMIISHNSGCFLAAERPSQSGSVQASPSAGTFNDQPLARAPDFSQTVHVQPFAHKWLITKEAFCKWLVSKIISCNSALFFQA